MLLVVTVKRRFISKVGIIASNFTLILADIEVKKIRIASVNIIE
jgi:hypothetical protein